LRNKPRKIVAIMAVASLFTVLAMIVLINGLVNVTLYNYGLQFSTHWAFPYVIYLYVGIGLLFANIIMVGLGFVNVVYPAEVNEERQVNNLSEGGQESASFGLNLAARVFRWVPTAVAVCGVVSLYAFSQIDTIVHKTLYGYGLQFSYDWATPYWNIADVVMAMGWVIVGLAVISQVYLLIRKSPLSGVEAKLGRLEQDDWSFFRLGDGSTIKVKLAVKGAKRSNKFSEDGLPVYTVDAEPVVRVVDVPEKLKAGHR